MGLILYKMMYPKTSQMEIADIRTVNNGIIPRTGQQLVPFQPTSLFKLFLDMISIDPNQRPGAHEIVRRCDNIILELKNQAIE